MPTLFGRSLGHAAYSSCRVLPVARARTRSPRLGALGSRLVDLFVAAFGARSRPRVAMEAFASAAVADVDLRAAATRRSDPCGMPRPEVSLLQAVAPAAYLGNVG